MGFDVTATHVIFFVAFLSIGSAVLGAQWSASTSLAEARAWDETLAEERAHTNLTVTSASYQAGPLRFVVTIKNAGSTVLDMTEFEYLVDGVVLSDSYVTSLTVDGVGASTDILLPTESAEVWLNPITTSPAAFQVVAGNGVTANWRA